jgi:hypothetical protein
MTFGEHVFLYCERGTNDALWAEPINAISNAGFFLAALIFWQLVLWRSPEERSADHYLFVVLVFLIGFGSLAFHLFADEGTALADVIPITVFMLCYLGFALNRLLGVPPGWMVLLAIVFAASIGGAMQVHCWGGGIGFAGTVSDSEICLNGSMAYLPALISMMVIGMALAERHHTAAPYILAAAVMFIVSVILRSADLAFCDQVVIEGRNVGTHFIWHLLNAVVLFLLLRASLEVGSRIVPDGEAAKPTPLRGEAVPKDQEPVEGPEVASPGEKAALEANTKEPQSRQEPEPESELAEASEPSDLEIEGRPKPA